MTTQLALVLAAIEQRLVVQYMTHQDVLRLEPAMCVRIHGNKDVVFGRSAAGGSCRYEQLGEWKAVALDRIAATRRPVQFEDAPPVPQEMMELVVKVLGREE